ncbi:GTP-binding protein [Nonomuraea roseola]|uniref:GTP-binding protein n=1 Tax=Nonomuraea roseola TaxID=46179 RepID=A0ABV5Q3N6_9ACTN
MSVPVVIVAGIHAQARAEVVAELARRHPGSVTIRPGDPQVAAPLLIVELGDDDEPRPVAEALAVRPELRLTGVLTALEADHMPLDICRGDRLPCGRHVAAVLARQIEYATGLVVVGDDPELALPALAHLAPLTPIGLPDVLGPSVDVEALAARVDPATAQLPCALETQDFETIVWRRWRPIHPQRLFDAVEELVATTVRSRGRFWLASRHSSLLAWDAVAGMVEVAEAGTWLAALPDTAWDQVGRARRAAAALDWTPTMGDRVQHLVFTGCGGLDPDRVIALLDSCLLTPEESVAGAAVWETYPDPFAELTSSKVEVAEWGD